MDVSIPQKDYHVYLLIDELDTTLPDGVFYVGFGKTVRLRSTIEEARYVKLGTRVSGKIQKIREIWEQGREPKQEVVFSSDSEGEARRYEKFLIQKYGARLTNHQGIRSKYPRHIHRNGVAVPLQMQEFLNSPLDSDRIQFAITASKEVTAFLEGIQQHLYPDLSAEERDPDLVELTRNSLTNSDSIQFLNDIQRRMPKIEQDCWLETLAHKIIGLTWSVSEGRRYCDDMWEALLAQGYRLEVEDVCVLLIRLARAAYIPDFLG